MERVGLNVNHDRVALGVRYIRTHNQYLERINDAIERVLRPYSNHPLFTPLNYSLQGGKRLRPLVCILVNESLGVGDEDPYRAAVALELLHTVSLIHDDFIDKPALRRGLPPYYKEFGVESAFLVADFVLGLTLSIASSYYNRRVGEELARTAIEMSHGEERERRLQEKGRSIPLSEYLEVIQLKTASLFRASAQIGALLSSKPETSESFARFGTWVGLAYQLRDDLADIGQPGELSAFLETSDGQQKQDYLETEAQKDVEKALKEIEGLESTEALNKLKRLLTDYF